MDVGGKDVDVCVAVGDGITTEVAVISAADVSVGDDIGSVVDVELLEPDVCVADGNEGAVTVAVSEIGVRVEDEVGGATVVATSLVAVTEIGVSVGVGGDDCGAFAGTHNNRQINNNNRMMATTSLNRS